MSDPDIKAQPEERVSGRKSSEAQYLAARIEAYWVRSGYPGIKSEVIAVGDTEDPIWTVRSNIGSKGFPPREMTE